jgi:hypothetical protein
LTQHVAAAGLEALGKDASAVQEGTLRLGIIVCLLAGCVTYSRRFFEEAIRDAQTASPLLFPETVFNAPASHLGALLGSSSLSYTLVGDEGAFLQGLPLAAGWLLNDQTDACLVIGAEEMDWISADATYLFARRVIKGAGAGALYLRKDQLGGPAAIAELNAVTDPFPSIPGQTRSEAARNVRRHLPADHSGELLCLSTQGPGRAETGEELAWNDWAGPRLAPKRVLGEAFTAAAAWQCVVACESIRRRIVSAANVSVVGATHQAIGARFSKPTPVHA